MIINNKYILASSSKSRKTILDNCGFSVEQIKPLCDEEHIKKKIKKNKKPSWIAKKLSLEKAKSISLHKAHRNRFVIGCDTLIYLNKKIFDKAKNMKEAKNKLKKLSGKKHKIVSGITICKEGKKLWQCSVTTTVRIRKLTSTQIENYFKKTGKQILNSVGCYQLESLGPQIIEDIKGDYFNVLGLPLFKLLKYVSKNK
ncbi:Maf family protein [Pelagibacteraceae bacterium]|nr:Maf family protein [Pelagibacteraceae bacterium]